MLVAVTDANGAVGARLVWRQREQGDALLVLSSQASAATMGVEMHCRKLTVEGT